MIGLYTFSEVIEGQFEEKKATLNIKQDHRYVIDSNIPWIKTSIGMWKFNEEKGYISLDNESDYVIDIHAFRSGFSLAYKPTAPNDFKLIELERDTTSPK